MTQGVGLMDAYVFPEFVIRGMIKETCMAQDKVYRLEFI